jgi:hypothetical protein
MPATNIDSGLIGASLTNVWKPPVGVTPGAAGDATAPFALGTQAQGTVANVQKLFTFCRVGATGIAAGATAGITNGVTVAAAGGNTYKNETGVALVTGDYVFLSVSPTLSP